ncbi:GNAT family N-acetyltransferase [Streptomyces lydicus]|uniref:GNAT family N-acetyltransferase n=1 Tax=Streptomyces lydicus TaxID=47763 RepID=UPI0036EDBEC6
MTPPTPLTRLETAEALDGPLCEELATLAQRCIVGHSDNRPVNAELVRSRLTNALTQAPPILVLARSGDKLVGSCAIRTPEPSEPQARQWGPIIHPNVRRFGLGTRLLRRAVGAVDWPLVSTDVPTDRTWRRRVLRWRRVGVLQTSTVLRGDPTHGEIEATDATSVGDLDAYVARAARRYGGRDQYFADMTLRRWRDDARFRPQTLFLDPPTGSLLLTLAQRNGSTSELLLAELWAATGAQRTLIGSARAAAGRHGLQEVRVVTVADPAIFTASGLRATGTCQTFALDR